MNGDRYGAPTYRKILWTTWPDLYTAYKSCRAMPLVTGMHMPVNDAVMGP